MLIWPRCCENAPAWRKQRVSAGFETLFNVGAALVPRGDRGSRHVIEKTTSAFNNLHDPLSRCRWRNQPDVDQITRGLIDIFFRRQIENEQAVDTGALSLDMKPFNSELQDRVHISVEHNRNF